MDIVQNDWQNIIGKMLLWGLIILLIFIPVRFALPYIFRKKTNTAKRIDQWRLLQLMVWIFYFTWFLFLFAEIGSWFTAIVAGVLLGILFLLYRYWLADVVAGILFKNQNKLHYGDIIHFENIKGKIVNLGYRYVEIENQDGYSIYLPYSRMQSGIIMKSESQVISSVYTFDLVVHTDENYPQLAEKIKSNLVALPWVALNKEPVVKLKERSGDKSVITVSVSTIDRSFTTKIEQHIRRLFER